MFNDPKDSIPELCYQFLAWLTSQNQDRVELRHLPTSYREADFLTACSSYRLLRVGQRGYWVEGVDENGHLYGFGGGTPIIPATRAALLYRSIRNPGVTGTITFHDGVDWGSGGFADFRRLLADDDLCEFPELRLWVTTTNHGVAQLAKRRLSKSCPLGADTPDRRSPAWERLKIIEQTGGNDIAQLDDRDYRVSSSATPFLSALQKERGAMVLGTTLQQTCGERPDRIYKSLPPELQSIIEKPGKGKHGYRML